MKTIIEKIYIRLLAAGLVLIFLSGNIYSQKSYKQSDFSRIFSNIKDKVTLIPSRSKTNFNLSPTVSSENIGMNIGNNQLENWMFDDYYFEEYEADGYTPIIDEMEESNIIKNWMLNDSYFTDTTNCYKTELKLSENENEESNKIKSWMLDDKYFNIK